MVSASSGPATFRTGFPVRPDRLIEARTADDVRETAKRLAGLVSQYDPAGLFGGPYEG